MSSTYLNKTDDTLDTHPYVQKARDCVGLSGFSTTKLRRTKEQIRVRLGHQRFLEFPL